MLNPCPGSRILDGFSLEEVQGLADENPSLRGYLQGYLAELQLRRLLLSTPLVASAEKIPDSSLVKGDLLVSYQGESLRVEAKSLRSGSGSYNTLSQAWEGSVECKSPGSRLIEVPGRGEIRATCIEEGRFDVLAVCTQPVTGEWSFLFAPEAFLPRAQDKPGFLQGKFRIDPYTSPGFFVDPRKAFDLALSMRIQR